MAPLRILTVIIEADEMEDGRPAFSVQCPELPAVSSWGFTQQEAFANAREALEAYLSSLAERGKKLPGRIVDPGIKPVMVDADSLIFAV